MLGNIERIEEGKIHLDIILKDKKVGSLVAPKEGFSFDVHEGMWLDVNFKPNPEVERRERERIQGLQEELRKREKGKQS